MAYSFDLNRLFQDLRGSKGSAALKDEFSKARAEFNRLRDEVKPKAEARIKKAEKQYEVLMGRLHKAQVDLENEVKARVTSIRKQAEQAEKSFEHYRKLAVEALRTSGTSKAKSGTKKTAKKKTNRKATRKKATKKAV